MKVKLKNVGMLDEAEFEVGNITLICGENNTGKTYATYSLYGYLDFMRIVRESFFIRKRRLFDDENLNNDIKDTQEIKLTYVDIKNKLEHHIKIKTKLYSHRILVKVLAGKNEDFVNAEFNVDIQISLESVKQAIKQYLENLNLNNKAKAKHIIYDDGIGFSNLNKLEFREYLEIFFDNLLNYILIKNFILSVERTGASIFQGDLDFIKLAKLEAMQKMLKEEDIDLFEFHKKIEEKKKLYPKPVRDNIDFIRDIPQKSKFESMFKKNKDKYKNILDLLGKIVGGKYKATEYGILYQPKGSKKYFNIEVASSSARSLLMLYFYILHEAQKGDILMIDEPELNLHPKNQILLARLLVLLANAGIKIFITTHSDYIVRELNNCIILNNFANEKIKENFKEYDDSYKLSKKDVNAYIAFYDKKSKKNTLKKVDISSENGIDMETFNDIIEQTINIDEKMASMFMED
ncbi:ATP-binding protein [Campylobacter jejuni]|nr:AAA family ATPase [Campylobacter sp. US55]EAL8497958.1 ATP-binding protein [Campylobacter jejuni]EDO8328551.1 AAA family ATPase [Campylobacter jejuni]EDO8329550.1 AAA family ATPase [Campylobacter jejuni]EKB9591943.1 AAA family ATPase [Campylobacter jejuni]TEX92824.1 ATP-binding protein [Campylobacter sp. US55]